MLSEAWRCLISRPKPQMRPIEIIAWWEIRRVPYNLIIGITAVFSLALFLLLITAVGELKPGEDAVEPMALMAAAVIMNLCYTAGWVVELVLMAIRRHDARMGPLLFKAGTAFSLVVAVIPSAFWGVVALLKLARVI